MRDKAVLLIVDDVLLNTQILKTVLQDSYEIKTANDGSTALKLSQQEPLPDLILLDVKMPDMNGYEVMHKLKSNEQTEDIPVIFITGSDTIEDEEKGLTMGAVDYITKPIRSVIVKARVKTHVTLKYQRDQLMYTALHDQLTGLYNRYHFKDEGTRKFAKAKRQNSLLSIIMVDIDHFKNINDNHGHLIGDEVLVQAAKLLNHNNRIEDFTARYGGEEFIIALEDCSLTYAKIKAESLREEIEELFPNNIKITASFGVAQIQEKHNEFIDLIKDADDALYKAKNSGRNKVIEAY